MNIKVRVGDTLSWEGIEENEFGDERRGETEKEPDNRYLFIYSFIHTPWSKNSDFKTALENVWGLTRAERFSSLGGRLSQTRNNLRYLE